MPTGALIRDFTKAYREVRYSEQGSIRLSEIEHNAYLNRLTIEITHHDAYRSVNYKTLPDNTHWGYLTSFKGSSVLNNLAVKFAKQRVYEHVNSHIWQFHQATESLEIQSEFVACVGREIVARILDQGVPIPGFEKFIQLNESLEDAQNPFLKWAVGFADPDTGGSGPNPNLYTAYPVVSPFPDVWKFKSDINCSFLLRLESWYLVNPLVYFLNNPTDTSDETEDEDEYPTPDGGDGDGGGEEFPPSSAPSDGSDPRDFAEDVDLPGTGVWTFTLSFSNPGNNPACNNVPAGFASLRGFPDEPPQREFTGPQQQEGGRPGRFFTSVDSFNHSGDCQVNGPGSPTFTGDGPVN